MQGVPVSSLPLFSLPLICPRPPVILPPSLISPFSTILPSHYSPYSQYTPISPSPISLFPISLPMPPYINIQYPKSSLSSPIFASVISVDILEKIRLRANSFARVFCRRVQFLGGGQCLTYFDYRSVYNRWRQNSFVL